MKKIILLTFFLTYSLFGQAGLVSPANFKVSPQAVEALKVLEGYRAYVYYDNNYNVIFGYGHLVLPHEEEYLRNTFGYETLLESGERSLIPPSKPMTELQKQKYVDDLLMQDIDVVIGHMKENITVSLKQTQVDAIIIYLFWRGGNALNEHVAYFYKLVNQKDVKKLMDFIANKPKDDKNYLPGLKRRNQQTVDLYMTGYYLFD
jgi:GH24 family phage-related lysozyme (muramidase)